MLHKMSQQEPVLKGPRTKTVSTSAGTHQLSKVTIYAHRCAVA